MTITPSTSAMTTTAQIRVGTAGDPGSGARTTPRAEVSAPATSCQDDQAPKFVLPRPLTFIGRRKRGRDAACRIGRCICSVAASRGVGGLPGAIAAALGFGRKRARTGRRDRARGIAPTGRCMLGSELADAVATVRWQFPGAPRSPASAPRPRWVGRSSGAGPARAWALGSRWAVCSSCRETGGWRSGGLAGDHGAPSLTTSLSTYRLRW
jgi:hypothetical protein